MADVDISEQLAWEERQRTRAALAAVLGAVLVIGSGVATAALFNGSPSAGLVDSLSRAGQAGGVGSMPSLRVPYYEFYDERSFAVLLTAIARGAGFVAIAYMLTYVGTAIRARSGEFRRFWMSMALGGGVLGAIATVLFTVGTTTRISNFLDGSRTVDRAHEIGDSSILLTAQLIGVPGTQAIGIASLALGLGWVVICLNAMRVGLLTRFMGVLGIICGVLIVLPILSPLPIVQTFWLGAMALLLAGRWPSGVPPAWQTGRAEPWPSQASVRQARQRAAAKAAAPADEPPADEPVAADPGRPHPASRKKKRKRRS